jgi:NADH:ubiquinone oxidoreductase subunit 3 (subunit A)
MKKLPELKPSVLVMILVTLVYLMLLIAIHYNTTDVSTKWFLRALVTAIYTLIIGLTYNTYKGNMNW